eukprot:gene15357-18216_t
MTAMVVYQDLIGAPVMLDTQAMPLEYIHSVLHSVISNYLLMGREDLATQWFCNTVSPMKLAPSIHVLRLFVRHYQAMSQEACVHYWHRFLVSSVGTLEPPLPESESLISDFIMQANENALALLPPRGHYQPLMKIKEFPPSLVGTLAPDTPYVEYITAFSIATVLRTAVAPEYVKVLTAANPYELCESIRLARVDLEMVLKTYLSNSHYMVGYIGTNSFINRILRGLIKERKGDLANRLLAACLKRHRPVSLKHVFQGLILNRVPTEPFIETIFQNADFVFANSEEELSLVHAYSAALNDDYATATVIFKKSLKDFSNMTLKTIVGAMIWAKITPPEERKLASFEDFIGMDFKNKLTYAQSVTYSTAIFTLSNSGCLGNLYQEYIAAIKAGEVNRLAVIFEVIHLFIARCTTNRAMVEAFKVLRPGLTNDRVPAKMYAALMAEGNRTKDKKLLDMLQGFEEPSKVNLSSGSIEYINSLIDWVEANPHYESKFKEEMNEYRNNNREFYD